MGILRTLPESVPGVGHHIAEITYMISRRNGDPIRIGIQNLHVALLLILGLILGPPLNAFAQSPAPTRVVPQSSYQPVFDTLSALRIGIYLIPVIGKFVALGEVAFYAAGGYAPMAVFDEINANALARNTCYNSRLWGKTLSNETLASRLPNILAQARDRARYYFSAYIKKKNLKVCPGNHTDCSIQIDRVVISETAESRIIKSDKSVFWAIQGEILSRFDQFGEEAILRRITAEVLALAFVETRIDRDFTRAFLTASKAMSHDPAELTRIASSSPIKYDTSARNPYAYHCSVNGTNNSSIIIGELDWDEGTFLFRRVKAPGTYQGAKANIVLGCNTHKEELLRQIFFSPPGCTSLQLPQTKRLLETMRGSISNSYANIDWDLTATQILVTNLLYRPMYMGVLKLAGVSEGSALALKFKGRIVLMALGLSIYFGEKWMNSSGPVLEAALKGDLRARQKYIESVYYELERQMGLHSDQKTRASRWQEVRKAILENPQYWDELIALQNSINN